MHKVGYILSVITHSSMPTGGSWGGRDDEMSSMNCTTSAQAAETTPGPVNALVVSVYDGDTFTADAMPWPG